MATIEDFEKIDIRVGTIVKAEINVKAKKPAYRLTIDFGNDIGVKISSAQLCQNYQCDELLQRQILAVVNFPLRSVAGVQSEVLVLAVVSETKGVVLLAPDRSVANGDRLA